jgi:L-gulonate 3-dehydrogenase
MDGTGARMKVAIVGVGFIGRAWAIAFARAGHEVRLWARRPEAIPEAIYQVEQILPGLDVLGLLNGSSPQQVLANLKPAADLSGALEGCAYAQESVAEVVDQKSAIFAELDRLAPEHAILASSSSALLPSDFSQGLPGRHRCLVVHPINPPFLIPAVEVVPASWTDARVVAKAAEIMKAIGQSPIVMQREIDGFIMNRLQGAVLQEAFRLVADGIARVEDIDAGIRDGLALRWAIMGPFETIDLNAPLGVRQYAERYEGLYASLHETQMRRVPWTGQVLDEIEKARRQSLPQEALENRRLWRDQMLSSLIAARAKARSSFGP